MYCNLCLIICDSNVNFSCIFYFFYFFWFLKMRWKSFLSGYHQHPNLLNPPIPPIPAIMASRPRQKKHKKKQLYIHTHCSNTLKKALHTTVNLQLFCLNMTISRKLHSFYKSQLSLKTYTFLRISVYNNRTLLAHL